jgi:transcriptional regulator with XRE-family HTH domain
MSNDVNNNRLVFGNVVNTTNVADVHENNRNNALDSGASRPPPWNDFTARTAAQIDFLHKLTASTGNGGGGSDLRQEHDGSVSENHSFSLSDYVPPSLREDLDLLGAETYPPVFRENDRENLVVYNAWEMGVYDPSGTNEDRPELSFLAIGLGQYTPPQDAPPQGQQADRNDQLYGAHIDGDITPPLTAQSGTPPTAPSTGGPVAATDPLPFHSAPLQPYLGQGSAPKPLSDYDVRPLKKRPAAEKYPNDHEPSEIPEFEALSDKAKELVEKKLSLLRDGNTEIQKKEGGWLKKHERDAITFVGSHYNVSQAALARAFGCGRTAISQLLSGKTFSTNSTRKRERSVLLADTDGTLSDDVHAVASKIEDCINNGDRYEPARTFTSQSDFSDVERKAITHLYQETDHQPKEIAKAFDTESVIITNINRQQQNKDRKLAKSKFEV